MRTARSLLAKTACWNCLLLCAIAGHGQQPPTIHVLLLNGNNGKPLDVGNTGKSGAPLSLTIFPGCGHVCFFPGQRYTWPIDNSGRTEVPNMANLKFLDLMKPSDWLVYCQGSPDKYGALPKDPEFAVDQILRTGVVAPNTCNTHLHLQAHPGELVFFLRPLTWWEELTKPPQM